MLLLALLKRFRWALYCEHISAKVTSTIDIAQRIQEGRKRLLEMRAEIPGKLEIAAIDDGPAAVNKRH
jgi:hypothetical protein